MPKTLYICYFGIREPLVQTQVLPYLRELVRGGPAAEGTGQTGKGLEPIEVSLLTFEPELRKQWTREELYTQKKKLADEGIEWHFTGYHKWPSVPATFFDLVNGIRIVRRLIASENFAVLHGRVHLATLIGAVARKLSRNKPKLLFDIRGFFPEEYTDAGLWPKDGWLFRSAKRVERWLLKEADGFVVLTEKARGMLFPASRETGFDALGRPVEVIPCCVDLDQFIGTNQEARQEIRSKLKIGNKRVIIYVGSFGGWYLTDKMMDFFVAARENDENSFALVLTQRDKQMVIDRFKDRGFGDRDFHVDSVAPSSVGKYLVAADVAIAFIKSCYSKQSSSPTKLAEYLAAGLPVIANRGVGDVDILIENNGVGAIVQEFNRESYVQAIKQVEGLQEVNHLCKATARKHFDLKTIGGRRYRRIYSDILR